MTTTTISSVIINDYLNVLWGNTKNFQVTFSNIEDVNRKNFKILGQYAIEGLLGWTPEIAKTNLTEQLLIELGLDIALRKIKPNKECVNYSIPRILNMIYPDKCPYNFEIETISIYKEYLKIDEFKHSKGRTLPKNFWSDSDAYQRVRCIVRYLINRDFGDKNFDQRELFFGNPNKADKWLRRYKLTKVLDSVYPSALEMYYDTMDKLSNIDRLNSEAKKVLTEGNYVDPFNEGNFFDLLDKSEEIEESIITVEFPTLKELSKKVEDSIESTIYLLIYLSSDPYARLGIDKPYEYDRIVKYANDVLAKVTLR